MTEGTGNFNEDLLLETVKLELTTCGITISNMVGLPIYPKEGALTLLYHGITYLPDKYILGRPFFSKIDNTSLWEELIKYQDTDPEFNIYHQVAKICYLQETDFLEKDDFNSIEDIEKSLSSYENFYSLLRKRKAYYETTKKFNNEFYVNGKLFLDAFGQVDTCEFDREIETPSYVMAKDHFENYIAKHYGHYGCSKYMTQIPSPNETCSICGKKFELNDLFSGNTTLKKLEMNDEFDKISHESCYLKEVKNMNEEYILDCITSVFKKEDCTFKEIPNEYGCNCKLCQNRPWYIVTTPYGKIKIGARKRVDSISFYKEGRFNIVNFKKLFKDENVTKLESRIDFTIHAWSKYDAIKYLKMVKDECDNSGGEKL